VFNGVCVLLSRDDARENINMRSAYLHLFTDMLTSVAVVAGGVAMYFTGVTWVDGVLSMVIAVYLIYSSWGLLIESLRILMQFTPRDFDLLAVESAILTIDEIKNVHHVHVWQLNDREIHFEGHLTLKDDALVSASDRVLERARRILHDQFAISHVTLQPEVHRRCDENLIRGE
jgi:cobalt-zinc-cadmium efflux system protein